MIPKKVTPEILLDLARRRWWLLAGPLVVALMIAVFLAVTLPRLYMSETTILVQPQEVPTSYVQPTVTDAVAERLQAMSQQILSRTKLLQIVQEFSLYRNFQNRPEEDLVDRMREDIGLQTGGKEKRGNKVVSYFKLSYSYPKPDMAQRVLSRLASLFIEENLKIRSAQAKQTSDFLEKELGDTKVKLQAQEQALSTYKRGFMGALPEQLQSNLSALNGLQTEMQTTQAALSAAEERAMLLQKSMSELAAAAPVPGAHPGTPGAVTGSPEARLAQLKQALPVLESRYTPKHPEVMKTQRAIATLEQELAQKPAAPADKADKAATGDKATAAAKDAAPPALTADRGLNSAYIQVRSDIERLKQQQEFTRRKIGYYQARVEATPQREQDLATLTRDYNMMEANYQSLLKKRIDAKMAENLENTQQGEQFNMIDPPNLPERPYKPNLQKLFSLAMMLGLGLGLGATFLREYTDRSFKDAEDLEECLHLNVLAAIPLVKTDQQVAAERRRKLLVAGACAAVFVVYAGFLLYARYTGLTINLPLLT